MSLLLRCSLALALTTVCPVVLGAQETRDPTQDLINTGRRALEDLNFHAADSIASLVLQLPRLRRAQLVQALQLAAAARYPASRPDQQADRAIEALQQLVRIAPDARVPQAISWSGLDSVHTAVRQTTFGATVTLRDSVPIRGFEGRVTIGAAANRPAVFTLAVRPVSGGAGLTLTDSSALASTAELSFQPVLNEIPRLASGEYRAEITAVDPTSGERVVNTVRVVLHTPPLPLHRLAASWDSAGVRPTHTRPSRSSSITSGLLVGGFTVLAGTIRRPERLGERKGSGPLGWGIGLGVSATALSWIMDRGRVIPANLEYNNELKGKWQADQIRLREENEAWSRAYVGYALLSLEDQ